MSNQYGNIRKLAGVAAMATLVTTAGWGMAAGTAQADVGPVTHNIVLVHHRPLVRDVLREGGPVDRFFDHFFNDDRMLRR
jgi:hypothetical protein